VILFDKSSPASCHLYGGAPGTAEIDLLQPDSLATGIDALLLTGGSAFGLEAAGGVRRFLETKQRGFSAGPFRVPIVPAAVIFDLAIGGGDKRPTPDDGYAASAAAWDRDDRSIGSIGAGTGATVAKYLGYDRRVKSGLSSRSVTTPEGVTIGGLFVVNAFGAIVDPATGQLIAAPRDEQGRPIPYLDAPTPPPAFGNTTIGVIATDALLTKAEAQRVAKMATAGLCRAIDPVGTPYDGDIVFVVSTGEKKMDLAKLGAWAGFLTGEIVSATARGE
jgi:L-aminopeptidase/D-esterase-like protein